MDYSIIDMESDGLLDTVTKIHCLCATRFRGGIGERIVITDYEEMRKFLLEEKVVIGHNIIMYDKPVFEKILGIKITGRWICTLSLSWYLFPERELHGLESWGQTFNILKPEVKDWENLSIETYVHRCSEDVKINVELFRIQIEYLKVLYNGVTEDIDRIMNYLSFKMDCIAEQEKTKWKLDIGQAQENLSLLEQEIDPRMQRLSDAMPQNIKYKVVSRPKAIHKKDGTVSVAGEKWLSLLQERGLPEYHVGSLQIVDKVSPGNPASHKQLKDWLFSLGWEPDVFKYKKEEDGSLRPIPQVAEDGELTDSVKDLIGANPVLEDLDGLYVINHRVGLLKGFLKNVDINGFLKARIVGLTNTLRFQHTEIVNLPGIPKPYWEMVRGCLVAPDENHILCGSDMKSLEDSTKRHYIYYYDPGYVEEMMASDFDAHLDIAVLAGLLTKEQAEDHKLYEATKGAQGVSHKTVRATAKKVNFAGVYGAGAKKIALSAKIPLKEASVFHTIYWKRNWAVKQISEDCIVKTVGNQMWLFNPVSQFWYSLRNMKDRFSTLNQGTGAYCFDMQVKNVRSYGIKMCGQFHDRQNYFVVVKLG